MRWTLLTCLMCAALLGCRTNETPQAQVDDIKIETQIKSKLASDVGVGSLTDIAVNSTNGVVTLAGQVDTADNKAKAEAVAKNVPKVVRVVNALQVVGKPESKPDTRSEARPPARRSPH